MTVPIKTKLLRRLSINLSRLIGLMELTLMVNLVAKQSLFLLDEREELAVILIEDT